MYIEFEPDSKHVKNNADISDSHEAFKDCGYLLQPSDLVIDIDHLSKDSIKKLLEIFDIQTQVVWTDRGAHLYFKRPEGHVRARNGICKLGFEIEQKTATNTPKGLTIKRNGKLREIDNFGIREELPAVFNTAKIYKNMTGLQEGDGRNEKLYKHKLSLKNCDDWLRILQFINENVFAEPLTTKEFAILSRQEDIQSTQKTEESDVADRIIDQRRCVKWSSKLWWWDYETKSYISDNDDLKRVIYQYCVGKKTTFVDEVFKQIDYRCHKYPKDHIFKIKLKNGFLDKGKFYPFTLDEFTPFSIDLDYKENAKPVEIVDNYLTQLTTKEEQVDDSNKYNESDFQAYKKVLLETLAFPLVVDHGQARKLSRFFLFRGDGANGKGTLLQIIKTIYGAENCSFLSIENMADERYLTSMIGKLVNLGDDIEDMPINKKQFKVIKNITTVDDTEIRFLYKQSEHVRIQSKLIFTTNNDIRTFDKGYALKRRMYWMPMFNKVTKPDAEFISNITTPEALEYWLSLLVKAYMNLCKRGWTKSRICAEYNEKYHLHNDLAEMFVREVGIESLLLKTGPDIQEMFKEWNTDDDRSLNKKNFKRVVWELHEAGFGISRNPSTGKTQKVLMLQSDTKQDLKPTFC